MLVLVWPVIIMGALCFAPKIFCSFLFIFSLLFIVLYSLFSPLFCFFFRFFFVSFTFSLLYFKKKNFSSFFFSNGYVNFVRSHFRLASQVSGPHLEVLELQQ